MRADGEKEIFVAALELPTPERAAFVQRRCGDDAGMRARVLRLLEAHGRAEEFMGAPTLDATPGAGRPAEADPGLGAEIGPYRLESVLGEGGFGRVYLARQREPVDRLVALKVLKAGMDSRAIVARFESERQALAVMDHPGVARVFDAGQTGAGLPYFVMEHVRGEPLTDYCRRQGLGIREKLALFEQVCLAVQHAHHKGIIHRDLKPSNVLVTTVDGSAAPKVIDFGIAKAIGPRAPGDTMMTLDGHLVGTPAYMSPEQVTGCQVMDTRSDVYTLGVLLYEVLTGTLPFETERLEKTPLSSLAQIICEETPPRPSTRVMRAATPEAESRQPARQLAGRLRGDLDWIVMRALEKEPSRRYQTAFAFASDIRRYLHDQPVEAGPPSGLYRLRKFSQRHRGELLAAGLVLVALVGGLISSLVFAARADEQRRLVARELEKSREFAAFTIDMLAGVDPAVAQGEDTAILQRMLGDAVERLEREPPEFPEVEAEIRNLIGTARDKIADVEGAEEQFRRALALARASLGESHPTTLQIWRALGLTYVKMTRLDDARRELTAVVDASRAALGDDDPQTIAAMFDLGSLEYVAGNYERSRAQMEQVVERRRAVLGDRHEDTMSARNSLAAALDELGEYEAALAIYREVLAFQLAALGPDHPHTLGTQNNIASSLGSLGRDEEAVVLLEQVLEGKRRVLGPDHPSLIVAMNNLSGAYRTLGRLDEAETMLRQAVETSRRAAGERDLRTLILTSNLAGLLIATERFAQAVELLTPAIPLCEESMGPDHPLALAMLSHLARARLGVGEARGASEVAAELVLRADRSLPADGAARADHRRLWGETLLRAGDAAQAERVLGEAYELYRAGVGAPGDAPKAAALLAEACDALGRGDEADRWRVQAAADEPEAPASGG